jgi:hypothetical protein
MSAIMHPLTISLLLGAVVAAAPASATGPNGQTLTVSEATGLATDGARLTVTGKGYDEAKGIYVAFCKDNGPGRAASPCGGGADTSGRTGGSQWISSKPPPYGRGLAKPYTTGGAFTVRITVKARISDTVDCAKVTCVVFTRADHTRTADRTADVRIPVSFGGDGGVPPAIWAAGGAAVVVVAGAATVLLTRRRRRGTAP